MKDNVTMNWDDVKKYIRENYKISDDDDDILTLVFEMDNARSQIVFIERVLTVDGDTWIQISSPIGIINPAAIEKALLLLNEKVCGGLIKVEDKYYVRYAVPIENLSIEEINKPMNVVMRAADEIEERFVGGDDN